MIDQSDERLAIASRDGDTTAYSVLVNRYARKIFAICLGMLGNVHDAEDAAQSTFLKGFSRINALRDCSKFESWLSRIAKNGCLDVIRKRRRPEQPQPDDMEYEEIDDAQQFFELKNAMEKLSSKHRIPLMLYYFDGHSTHSLARELNLSPAGACTRLSRARQELRKLLEEGQPK